MKAATRLVREFRRYAGGRPHLLQYARAIGRQPTQIVARQHHPPGGGSHREHQRDPVLGLQIPHVGRPLLQRRPELAGIGAIIAYALYATALRISIDQLFGPLALGTAARVHPVLLIFCFLSGALLFGMIGVIMAIPVALAVKVTLALLYDEPATQALAGQRSAK